MNPLITVFSWLAVIAIIAYIDSQIIKKGKSPLHGWKKILLLCFLVIPHGVFIAKVHTPENFVPDDYTLAVLIFYACSWWSFFDALLNKMRGKDLFYIGEHDDEVDNAGSDKLFQRLGKPSYIISKVVCLGLSIVCFYIMIAEWKNA